MSVQQARNYVLAKHSFAAQVCVTNADISTMLGKLYESKFKEENSSVTSKVSEELEGISAKDRKFLKLMDAETNN